MQKKFIAHPDHMRVVPLYRTKQKVDLADLKKSKEDSELFDGGKAAPAIPPKLTYNGGPLLPNTEVYTIFWGTNWANNPTYVTLANNINNYFTAILASPLIDQLSEYNVPDYTIGHGKLTGTHTITANAPAGSITDDAITTALQQWIQQNTIPGYNANTLYFLYMDINVTVVMGGGSYCQNFCGYHNAIGSDIYYAVMPFLGCPGCLADMTAFDALTGTSSHELCEAITDPVPGTGWYDNANNAEIGDLCAWTFKTVAGYNVQLEWSNAANACV
jgi:hypothetical protein